MAARFLVVLDGNATRLSATAALVERRMSLARAATWPEMVVFTNEPGAPVGTRDRNLLVLGHLYARPSDPGSHSIDVESIPGTGSLCSASELLARYWGSYVAIIRRPGAAGGVEILRDPSGGLPCYRVEKDGQTIVCSDVDLAARSGLYEPSVDRDQLIRHLWTIAFRSSETALTRFREIPNGQSLLWRPEGSTLVERWSPWDHVGRHARCSDEELAERLRTVIQDCVVRMASRFGHVLHCLSGGLDSSIVAACLDHGDTPFTALNLIARGDRGDERIYAAEVARHCQIGLVERRYTLDAVDLGRSSAAHLPRPVGEAVRLAFDRACDEEALRVGAGAQFSGNGGDNVFCFLQSSTPVVDRLLRQGPGPGTWATLGDMSRLTGTSVWTMMKHAAQRLSTGDRSYRWKPVATFLDTDAVRSVATPIDHPWLEVPRDALPGEAVHVALLLRPQNYMEGHSRDAPAELVTPLMAQPIMELCLGIPSWRWCAGGRDRSLARRAFAKLLPARVIDRRSKGGPAGFYHEIIEKKGAALRAHLLDGVLAKQGVLDRAAINAYFRQSEGMAGDEFVRILSLSDAESWTRHWLARSSGTTAAVRTG